MTSPFTTRDVTLLAYDAALFGLRCYIQREGVLHGAMCRSFYTTQTPPTVAIHLPTQGLQIRQTSSLSMPPVLPLPPAF